jgi:hypothetical protein
MTSTQPSHTLAREVLDGTVHVPKGTAIRAAAFLARQAFEEAINTLCQVSSLAVDRASMRFKIILIRLLNGDETGERAALAWAGLCRACHHHAYELVPPADEINRWLDLVAALLPSEAQAEASVEDACSTQ